MNVTNPPAGASVPTDAEHPVRFDDALTGAVEVLPDKCARVGLLSYTVPPDMVVHVGDAVQVPFGAGVRHGLVVGPATDPQKATKAVSAVHGKRCDPRDIDLARTLAKYHFADLATVLGRLAPPSGRGAPPLDAGPVRIGDAPRPPLRGLTSTTRRLIVRAPGIDPAHLAAHEAARLIGNSTTAQVLILCPTTASVRQVTRTFTSGAARLDRSAAPGAWKGFTSGTVQVGVGTRAAALYAAANLAGIIVVDEEHPGHLEATQPHTHARDIANARARALGVPLTLIAATPTPAALGAGVSVGVAGTRNDWPTMRLIDRGDVDPIHRWAPPALRAAIAAQNKDGRTPLVLVQRKAAVRRCTRCGAARPCRLCDTSLCRHQDSEPCPACASTEPAKMVGWDATRVADLLNGPPTPGAEAAPAKVRIVTVADLNKTRDAGLVVLFDIDAALSFPELIPEQMAASVIATAAAAAGPDGTVLALTDTPTAATLVDLFGPRDQLAGARRALAAAKAAQLPPFGRLVTIRCGRTARPTLTKWPGSVLGPTKIGTDWQILIRIGAPDLLSLGPHIARLRRGGKVRITVA